MTKIKMTRNCKEDLYCSYCGEKIDLYEDFILLQEGETFTQIRHTECEYFGI